MANTQVSPICIYIYGQYTRQLKTKTKKKLPRNIRKITLNPVSLLQGGMTTKVHKTTDNWVALGANFRTTYECVREREDQGQYCITPRLENNNSEHT